jgi:hypothetical protein
MNISPLRIPSQYCIKHKIRTPINSNLGERDELTRSKELTLSPLSSSHRRRHPRLAASCAAGGAVEGTRNEGRGRGRGITAASGERRGEEGGGASLPLQGASCPSPAAALRLARNRKWERGRAPWIDALQDQVLDDRDHHEGAQSIVDLDTKKRSWWCHESRVNKFDGFY